MFPKKASICSADFSISEKEALQGPSPASSLQIENNNNCFEPKSIQFLNYYKGFLDFGFFLLIVPWRLKKDTESGHFYIHTNLFQQLACGIIQILVLYDYITLFRLSSWKNSTDNPINYLTSASYLGYIAYSIVLNYGSWCKRRVFKKVFERFQSIRFYDTDDKKWTNLKIMSLSYGLCLGVSLMTFTDSSVVEDYISHGNLTRYYQIISKQAQRHYLLIEPDDEQVAQNNPVILFVTCLRFIVLLPSLILVPYLDFFALVIPLSVWHLMKEFRKFCKNTAGCPVAAEKIFEKYAQLKKLLRSLNAATGSLMFCIVAVSLPYYAAWTGMTFFEDNLHFLHMLHFYTFFSVFFLVLTAAADLNKKGTEFFCWISSPENSEGICSKTIASLLIDLHSSQIALKGAGFFFMTYRFLGTMFGVIVTYSIITIQIQISRKAQNVTATVLQVCNSTM